MRPVNLIPAEQRRGERAQTRTGNKMYFLLGGLAAVLLGLALIVTTGNSISDRKAEKKQLQSEKSALEAQSGALRHYADFAQLEQARQLTVASLAQSRFDWERVIRELSLVLPADVWLTKVTGTVSPSVNVDADSAGPLRDAIPGPALELTGCGRSQNAVARLIAALHEIDGVTRVGVTKSERSSQSNAGSASGDGSLSTSGSLSSDCRTRDSIPQFEIVVAFDNVQAGAAAAAAGATSASTTGIGDAQQQPASAAAATQSATQKATTASKIVPGT